MSSIESSRRPVNADSLAGRTIAVDGRYLARPGMGINRYVAGLVGALLDAGAEVTVLTSPAHPVQVDARATVAMIGGHTQVSWEQIHLLRHFRKNRYDLYWAPANGGVPLFATRRQRILVTEHDLIPLLMPSAWFPKNILWGIAFFVSFISAMLRADRVVAPSRYTAREVRRVLGRRARVVAPIADTAISERGSSARPMEEPYVLYHGGLGKRKRVDSVLSACANWWADGHPFHLVLLGRGYEQFDAAITSMGLEAAVKRPGLVSDAERDRWVMHAFAIVYPSEMEGFGLPVLEGMSSGVPVVTSPNSSLLEVGGSGVLYANPGDPTEIARNVVALADPRVRTAVIAAGHEQAARYRPSVATDSTVSLVAGEMSRR